MPLPVEYDEKTPPQWFKLNNIKYWLRDPVVINGEESSIYYGLISKIRKNNLLQVQWFYLPHEMVMSKVERASLHPNEIFATECTDDIDIEAVQMKAAIFHTRGFAPPRNVPQEWLILRRKYDPYKNQIKNIDLVADRLQRIDKLNVSLCEPDHRQKTPKRTTVKNPGRTSRQNSESDSDRRSRKTVSSSDESQTKPSKNSSPTDKRTKSTFFFMSAEDFQPQSRDITRKQPESFSKDLKNSHFTPQPKSIKFNDPGSKSESRKGRSTKLTSELETLSLAAGTSSSLAKQKLPVTQERTPSRSSKTTQDEKTPSRTSRLYHQEKTPSQTTRSGRKVKPVDNFHSLQKSLALEALARSNLLPIQQDKTPQSSSDSSSEDQEISFKENKRPISTPSRSKAKSKKKKRRESSSEDVSSGEEFTVEKKKKSSSRTPLRGRTPLAPKNLKPTLVMTPCVIPMRDNGNKKESSYSLARTKLHVSAVPESLPCREEQFADIYYFLETKLEEGSGGCMYISGVPGTGKTATVRDVLTHISDGDFDYQMIEINGMKLSDPKQLYSLIYRHLEGKKVTPDHGNLLLSEYFGKHEKKSIVLVVDELDLLWTRKQHVMYNLFDWPNRPNSKLVVIAIANTMDLPERMLMNKVASRLGLTRMTFQPYSHKQLLEIINSRLERTTAFAPEACMLAARKVAAASGDARRALDICRHAIDIAELEAAANVTSLHIQRAITNMYQSAKTKAIINCTLYQKIFLKSVLGVFRRKGVEEAVFKEVYEVFCSLCQFQSIFCPPCGSMLKLCLELGSCRILLVEQGPPTLHTHIRLNCAQDDVVFALKETSSEK